MFKLDEIETLFFQILEDLKEYLSGFTLVGGWLPYIYTRFLWKEVHAEPVTTVDVDFGIGEFRNKTYSKTIFDLLSNLDYEKRHIALGKLYPIVFYKRGKIPVEFITFPGISDESIERVLGRQIHVNKIEGFDFLLKHIIRIDVKTKKLKSGYTINCPVPSAFLYHKGATFVERETNQEKAKDLYYMYFILRYAPDIDCILKEIVHYKKKNYFKNVQRNLNEYFERKSSLGCLMVEKENGPDEYIDDIRKDIFERFETLRKLVQD